jgi:hypothetical protein
VKADDYEIRRVSYRGDLYTPVVVRRTGAVLPPEHVKALASVRDPASRDPRRFAAILIDEGPLADADTGAPVGPYRLESAEGRAYGGVRFADPLPLQFGDSGLAVGTVGDIACLPPGALTGPESIGHHLVGTATMRDTVLASVVWRAVRAGVLSGVCVVIAEHRTLDDGRMVAGLITHVTLGPLELSCCARARILDTSEIPA